jgi:8-oxo-dGTP pyrophosphatase MutT (NUDIX family)
MRRKRKPWIDPECKESLHLGLKMAPGIKKLSEALQLQLPYSFDPDGKLSLGKPRGTPSAVLILLEPQEVRQVESWSPWDSTVLLTKRSETVEHHKGQISFPGGVEDPEDRLAGGLQRTALREAHEELGIQSAQIQVVGELPALPTITGFWISPIVAVPKTEHWGFPLSAEPKTVETAEVFRANLRGLDAPGIWKQEWVEHRTPSGILSRHPVDAFYWSEHRIWGATGAMLKNLIERLKRVER